jgi:hypothetical protein
LPLQIIVNITKPSNASQSGMYQLELINDSNEKWITGISIHLLDLETDGYAPTIYITSDFSATSTQGRIQLAIDEWEELDINQTEKHARGAIIFIPPNTDDPGGAHLENIIMGSPPCKLQGIGPGGGIVTDEATRGTYLNGGNAGAGVLCEPQTPENLFCDAQATDAWRASAISKSSADNGNTGLVEGPVLYVLGSRDFYVEQNWTDAGRTGGIDGCLITGGTQMTRFPNYVTPQPNEVEIVGLQGGGITVSCN